MLQIGDTWFCAEGSQDGRPVLIRGRQNLQEVMGCGSHPILFRIVWQYEVKEASGLPSSELQRSMADFENIILGSLERDFLCIFFCVYVHNGVKEWAAYCSDVQATCDRFNVALAEHKAFPVRLTVEDDSEWQEYRTLLRDTGMAATPGHVLWERKGDRRAY